MQHNLIETVMGFVVLVIAAFFLAFAYFSSQHDTHGGYPLSAHFSRVDGILTGTDVRLSGVKVGTVTDIEIDPESYLAIVKMDIEPTVKLPTDTSAEIVTNGLLGSKYIAVVPGGDETYLSSGDEIKYTQSAISIEAMIGQLIFSKKDKDEDDDEEQPQQ